MVKNTHANAGNVGLIPGLGEKMATHSSVLAWRISWAEEPEELQSMGSQGVRHDLTHTQQYSQKETEGENLRRKFIDVNLTTAVSTQLAWPPYGRGHCRSLRKR